MDVTEQQRCRFDADERPYACLTHNTQRLNDENDQCEYKRMLDAEAAIERVQELCEKAQNTDSEWRGWIPALIVLESLREGEDE